MSVCKDEGMAFRWFYVCARTREWLFVCFMCVQGRGNVFSMVLCVQGQGNSFSCVYVCNLQ